MNLAFLLSNALVLPFWFLMIALPHWNYTQKIMRAYWPFIPINILFVVLFLPQVTTAVPILIIQPTLSGMKKLIATDIGVTTMWVHLVAADLFIGRWMYWDSRERALNPLLSACVLTLTLFFCPLGLLIYFLVRKRS